jgi:hypothetical protein
MLHVTCVTCEIQILDLSSEVLKIGLKTHSEKNKHPKTLLTFLRAFVV